MPSNHLILCLPFSSSIRIFSSESALHIRWQKYWSFRFSISPCNEYSESFRIDWFDLLAVQGTLKSLLEHHSSKTSILRHSDFFKGFPGGSDGKEFACNEGDLGSIHGLGRSPGGGHGNLLQYSCLENPHGQRSLADYTVHGVEKSQT